MTRVYKRKHNIEELKGKTFSKWTILDEVPGAINHLVKVRCECGTVSKIRLKYILDNKSKQCRSCSSKDRMGKKLNRKSFETRFWDSVIKKGTEDCWVRPASGAGYGRLKVSGKQVLAHRVSWIIHFGPIPNLLQVLHKCDNPPCVNPAHLFLGTNYDNVKDKVSKNRQHRGEKSPQAILTEQQVKEIKQLINSNTLVHLGKKYQVHPNTISGIKAGKKWKHVK